LDILLHIYDDEGRGGWIDSEKSTIIHWHIEMLLDQRRFRYLAVVCREVL